MSSQTQSDLLRIDVALRSSPSRALLKDGSVDAWTVCKTSLQAVLFVLRDSVLAEQSGSASAAVSMHWRKSSASKKLLALLRAVVEEAHALQGEAAIAATARITRCHAVHGSISAISLFWQRSQQSATLWLAMREWIVEQGGVTSLWTTLAWMCLIPAQDIEAAAADDFQQLLRGSVHAVFDLTRDMFSSRRPVELAHDSAVVTVFSCLLSDLLPRNFTAGNGETWDLNLIFRTVMVLDKLEEGMLAAHLHRPVLVFWPYLI